MSTASLREIADAYRAALPAEGRLTLFRIDALDRTGIPVVQANLELPGLPIITGHGYGFEPVEAELGALGELCEEVHCSRWLAERRGTVASYADMVREHGGEAVLDPLTLCLPAGSAYHPDQDLHWLGGTRLRDGSPAWIPADWVASHGFDLGHAPDLITPITNGLGAGFTLDYAVGHGIMEQLQRDGNVLGYRALDRGAVVEADLVRDAEVRALLDRLRAAGIAVTIKLAATDLDMPNLYVVGDDAAPTSPLQITACGEAAHPDRERALRKALLEFCGSRVRKLATHGSEDELRRIMPAAHVDAQIAAVDLDHEEPRALRAMAEWLEQDAETLRDRLATTVFSRRNSVALSSLPGTGRDLVSDPAARLRALQDRLGAEDMECFFVEFTPPGAGPVRTVKTVVPGLESETMSYGRIGWRGVRRLRDRGDALISDTPADGAERVRLRPEDEARAGGPAWFNRARADALVGALYPLYREPGCFAARALLSRHPA